jgi:putative transposase
LEKLIYHTDQGGVFMSDNHISMCKLLGVQQSMSRRGNCLDNAPIESFFGHMKDEINFKSLKSLEDAKIMVGKYIKYYNFDRPQWGLKKMTPVEYRSQEL